MATNALEKFVRKVFAEEGFRTRFMSHPEEAMSEFELTSEERESLLRRRTSFDLSSGSVAALAAKVDPLSFWFS